MSRARLAVLLAVAGLALTGCASSGSAADGASGTGSTARGAKATTTRRPTTTVAVFSDPRFGFTFSYPKDWATGDFKYDANQTGARPAASTAVGIDQNNSVLLTRYNLDKPVTAQELPAQLVDLNGVITRFAGRPYVGETTDVGGLPAVRYQTFTLPNDAAKRSSRVVFLFDGNAEYELNCQSTPAGGHKIDPGCNQILATLRRR